MKAWRLFHGPPSHVVTRRLHADDLDRIFSPSERILGEQWLARQERGELYVTVAEVNGTPVGRRCLDLAHDPNSDVGFCFAAAVLPKWRSYGIGTRIEEHMERVARTHGLRGFRCVVDKENPRALTWHERLGYKCIGETSKRWTGVDDLEVERDCWMVERVFGPRTSERREADRDRQDTIR